MKRVDLTGRRFGDLTALEYIGNKKWKCECTCGNVVNVSTSSLLNGKKSCGHKTEAEKLGKLKYDLTGRTFGEWEVLRYVGNQKWLCRCSCGIEREILSTHLRNGLTKSCGHGTTGFIDLTNKTIGDWLVQRYLGNQQWECRCLCGVIRVVSGSDLRSGKSKSCGHNTNTFKDETGKTYGDWKVLRYLGRGNYECQCSCGTVATLKGTTLRSGQTTNCQGFKHKFLDLTGQKFWEWTALEYLGNHLWLCQCSCGNTTIMTSMRLRSGESKSCGCKKAENYRTTLQERYGVNNISQLNQCKYKSPNPKETNEYQLNPVITTTTIYKASPFPSGYLSHPNQQIIIEFIETNVTNTVKKPINYHQDKTIQAEKSNIHIIHIFEHEWNNPSTQSKLINLIKEQLRQVEFIRVAGRKCVIRRISQEQSTEFLDSYHLQGFTTSTIALGCFNNSELLGVMTFGKPRFNDSYEWELIRMAWKPGYLVNGGSSKLLTAFIREFKPSSIISYCDISKFTGKSYEKMGFKGIGLTPPNYKWVNPLGNKVFSRYQTMKHKLIKAGLGTEEQSENEIMGNLGFLKVYDCGNRKYLWNKDDKEVG